MKNEELLHIAVELGSLIEVKGLWLYGLGWLTGGMGIIK